MIKIKHLLLFTIVLVLLVGAVSASEVSNDTTDTQDSKTISTSTMGSKEVVRKEANIPTTKIREDMNEKNIKSINKKENENVKTAVKTYDVENLNDLDEALHANNKNVVINMYSDVNLAESFSPINSNVINLTINGNGRTIHGDYRFHFLSISSQQVVIINNLTMYRCKDEHNGGAILNNGTLTVINSTLTGNHARQGGGIYNYHGNLTIINSTLNNNFGDNYGGAIYKNDGTLNIINSTLNNNGAKQGGGIYSFSYEVDNITDCNFKENYADSGGAIYAYCANLTRNVFTGNTAKDKETIYFADDMTRIFNGNIYNSTDVAFNQINLTVKDYDEKDHTYDINDDLIFNYTIITKDSNNYKDLYQGINITLYMNTFEMVTGYENITLSNLKPGIYFTRFYTCNAYSNELIIDVIGNVEVNVSNYQELIETLGEAKNYKYDSYKINLLKGEYIATQSINLEDFKTSKFIINGNGNIFNGQNSYNFIETSIQQDVTIENLIIINCSYELGGAIRNWRSTLTIKNCTINNNVADNGGAICNSGTLTIMDSLLINNTANEFGGAIDNREIMTLINCTINNNHAIKDGGAIENDAPMTLINCTINDNVAGRGGGAINNYKRLQIINSTLNNNSASDEGGAIYNGNSGSLIIEKSGLYNNTATVGGALFDEGTYNLSDTTFYNNSPVNFIINDNNHIQLSTDDNFINVGNFMIIADYQIYSGNGLEELEQLTIPADADNVKLIFNGTNQINNKFFLKNGQTESNVAKADITNKNPTCGSTTSIAAIFIIDDSPISEGMVIFRLNDKTMRDDEGKVMYVSITEGIALLKDVPITNAWTKGETTLQAIFIGNDELEPISSEKTVFTVSKREAQLEITAPNSAQPGETITLYATVTAENLPVTSGRVAFKLNGKTLKDGSGKALYVDVKDGRVSTRYTIPAKTKANLYTLTAIFADNSYERCQNETKITIYK